MVETFNILTKEIKNHENIVIMAHKGMDLDVTKMKSNTFKRMLNGTLCEFPEMERSMKGFGKFIVRFRILIFVLSILLLIPAEKAMADKCVCKLRRGLQVSLYIK